MALGVIAAAGASGWFAMLPVTQQARAWQSWCGALLALAATPPPIMPLTTPIVERQLSIAHT